MTKSQIKAVVATIAAALAALDGKMDVLTLLLPPKYAEWLRLIIIIGGLIVAVFNQSASRAHVSVPVETAKSVGLDVEKLGGKA